MSSSVLPWKLVIESLADVPDVSTYILSALVDRFPDVLTDNSGAVRERLALRCLEECSGMACGETPPAVATNAPSTSASAAKIDAAQTCEEVLRSKVAASNDDGKGKGCLDDGDLQQFILLKRATLPKSSIDLLKETILASYHPDLSCSKEFNGLHKMSTSVRVNHLTSNNHRDHDGIGKIIRTMKHTNPLMKKLAIIRKYRKFKKLANNIPLREVGGASQKISSSQQHFVNQKSPDDEQRNQQSNVDGTCNVQFCTTEKTNTNTSEELHGVGIQLPKDNLSGYVPAPNGDPDDFEGLLQSRQQSEKQNVLHDGADSQELVDGDSDDLHLLEQNSMPQSSSAQSLCIKCSKSGQLLNCSGDGCLRSVHESCLGLLAGVEESGLFYCPFCAYRNARIMYQKSKRKAREARQNLFSFYDIGPTVNVLKRKISSARSKAGSDQVSVDRHSNEHPDPPSNQQLRNSSVAQRLEGTQNTETSNSNFVRDYRQGIIQNQQNKLNVEDATICKIILPCRETIECHIHQVVQDTPVKLKNDFNRELASTKATENQQPVDDHGRNEHGGSPCNENTSCKRNGDASVTESRNEVCRDHLKVEEIKNVHNGDADQEHISLQASKISPPLKVGGECDHNAKRKALALQISDRFAKRNRRDKAVKIDNYEGVVENQQTSGSSSRELRKNAYRQNLCSTLKRAPSRRTKLIWKPEEEEILEEAMQKIPKNEDGSIPWTKILEYGRRSLHESRTPIDLKDKWRNMQKKEAKTKNRS